MKKWMLSLLVLVLLLAGCSSGNSLPHFEDGDVVGSGSAAFTLEITGRSGETAVLTVHTDEESVGAALQAEHIIFGEQGDYGLYILTVNGETLSYEEDGSYWAFYVNDVYAEKSVDLTPVEPGAVYALRAETI